MTVTDSRQLAVAEAGDGADFLALGDGAGEGQERGLIRVVRRPCTFEQARRVQRGDQLEGPPGDRLIGVDLREVAAAAFGRLPS